MTADTAPLARCRPPVPLPAFTTGPAARGQLAAAGAETFPVPPAAHAGDPGPGGRRAASRARK